MYKENKDLVFFRNRNENIPPSGAVQVLKSNAISCMDSHIKLEIVIKIQNLNLQKCLYYRLTYLKFSDFHDITYGCQLNTRSLNMVYRLLSETLSRAVFML